MSRAAFTIRVWAIYVLLFGTALAVIPNVVLSTLGMAETDEPWIRVLGLVLVLLALYYSDATRNEARHHFVASVLGRLFVAAAFIVLVITGEPWQLFLFAAVDVAGAVWTLIALRDENPV
jgi:peptidoglycan/LPS O-acetylase OafA/YrhL